MAYPTDAAVDEALRDMGQSADHAAKLADRSGDPRDIDAAVTAEAERQAALKFCVENNLVREVAAGEIVDDLPAGSIEWLLAQGHIAAVVEGQV